MIRLTFSIALSCLLMVLIHVSRPTSRIRLTHSPSGAGLSARGDDTNAAWDFQLIVPDLEQDSEYELAGRLIDKRRQGCRDVLNEVRMLLDSPESSKSMDNVRIEHGNLAVTFRDNSLSPRHLSGIASLRNLKHAPDFDAFDPDSVGASAGLNFEHIISGHTNPNNKFTPRYGPYRLLVTGAQSVKLVRRPSDSPWKVGSELSYRIVEPHYIDFEFRCTPQDAARFGERGYAIFFFANYMNDVLSPALRFRGHRSAGSPEKWIVAEAPKGHPDWMSGGNYRGRQADELEYGDDVRFRLNTWTYDWPRIAKPFYYGLAENGMTMILMFDRLYSERDQIRFSLYKFKLPDRPRPAWDFQYVINHVQSGEQYGFKGRLVWKKFVSPKDCQHEYDLWRRSLELTSK